LKIWAVIWDTAWLDATYWASMRFLSGMTFWAITFCLHSHPKIITSHPDFNSAIGEGTCRPF
jgi:hypothetical protein